MRKLPIAERLERNSIPEPNSGCLLWLGSVSKTSGHGRMKIDGRWDGPHRVAYAEKNGPIPPGLDVCHHCDVPSCINDAHLFAGTHQDNMADMWAKGRGHGQRRGQPTPAARIIGSCTRCDADFSKRRESDKYCSPQCRWNVTRTPEQKGRYNAARAAARAQRASGA